MQAFSERLVILGYYVGQEEISRQDTYFCPFGPLYFNSRFDDIEPSVKDGGHSVEGNIDFVCAGLGCHEILLDKQPQFLALFLKIKDYFARQDIFRFLFYFFKLRRCVVGRGYFRPVYFILQNRIENHLPLQSVVVRDKGYFLGIKSTEEQRRQIVIVRARLHNSNNELDQRIVYVFLVAFFGFRPKKEVQIEEFQLTFFGWHADAKVNITDLFVGIVVCEPVTAHKVLHFPLTDI